MIKKPERNSGLFIALLDAAAVVLAYYLAFLLRFDFNIPAHELHHLVNTAPLVVVFQMGAFYYFGLYRSIWRYYGSMEDLTAIIKSIVVSQVTITAVLLLTYHPGFPRSVTVIGPITALILVGGTRFFIRLSRGWRHPGSKDKLSRMLIFGAGDLGETVLRELQRSPAATRRAVCFLDDNAAKHGCRIHGVPVLGGRDRIAEVVAANKIDEVLVAVNHARGKLILDLMTAYAAGGCERKVVFKTLPTITEMMNDQHLVSDIREINVADLMHRRVVDIDITPVRSAIAGKTVLVTGAGGTIGSEICRQVIPLAPEKLILLEVNNTALFYMDKELREAGYEGSIVPVPGDVRDGQLLKNIFEKYHPSWVLHTSAHKHVALMENNPQEAVKNNTLATYLLAKTAAAYNAERFLFISTDKAVRPSSVMGASKRLGEMAVRSMAGQSGTKFMSVRFGNVLGSSGSVVKIFQEQISSGGPVTVTHPEVIRYFMTTKEAVSLVLTACAIGTGGEIFVLNMGEPVKILDLARNMIVLNGLVPGRDIKIRFTGLKPGEKMHEDIFSPDDIRKDTGYGEIFTAISKETGAALVEEQMLELGRLSALPDNAPLLKKIKDLIPTYRVWDAGAAEPAKASDQS